MPRVTLVEQPHYKHRHVLTVRATDINYAGHLSNEALLALVHEARANFLKELGFNTIVDRQQPVGLIIADLAVNFKTEAFAHQQVIIESQIGEIGTKSFRLFHRIRRKEQLIALVEAGMIAFSYRERKSVSLQPEFMTRLKEYHQPEMESIK